MKNEGVFPQSVKVKSVTQKWVEHLCGNDTKKTFSSTKGFIHIQNKLFNQKYLSIDDFFLMHNAFLMHRLEQSQYKFLRQSKVLTFTNHFL